MAHDSDRIEHHPRETRSRGRRDSVLRIVTDASRMREVMERQLWRPGDGAGQIANCRVGKIRTGHGCRFLVEYHLRLHAANPGKSVPLMVTALSYPRARTRRLWETLRAAEPRSPALGALAPASTAPFSYVPDLDMLLQVFPHDARLPGLAPLMAGCPPELWASLTADFGGGAWRVEDWTAESLKYRPTRRATLRLKVRARHTRSNQVEERLFYAKVYPDRNDALRAYQRQVDLHRRIEAAGAPVGVARPVAHAADLHTVVQSAVPGVSLDRLIASGPDADQALRVAARGLAGLHQMPMDAQRFEGYESPRSLANSIDRLARDDALLRTAHPELAGDIATLVATIVAGLSGAPRAAIHGDLKPEHVFIDGSTASLIDFDFLRAGDPLLDVVRMETYLAKTHAPTSFPGGGGAPAQDFLEAYLASSPADVQVRLPLYRAMTTITTAARLQSGEDEAQRSLVPDVIRRATSLLQQPGGQR